MLGILSLVVPFFGMIAIGACCQRFFKLPPVAAGWMNIFILYVALPCLFFKLLSKTPVDQLTHWHFFLTTTSATLIVFLLMFAIAMLCTHKDVSSSTIAGLAASYGNVGFLGPPIALAAFGPDVAVPVALVFCFDNALLFTLTPVMMEIAGKEKKSPMMMVRGIVSGIIFHPFIVATLVSLFFALSGMELPTPFEKLVSSFADAAGPCALFIMGVSIASRPIKRIPSEIGFILIIKLMLHPTLVYIGLHLVDGFPPQWVFPAVLMASLPTASNVFVLAQQYGIWSERASAAILISTIVSMLTLSVLLYLMQNGLI